MATSKNIKKQNTVKDDAKEVKTLAADTLVTASEVKDRTAADSDSADVATARAAKPRKARPSGAPRQFKEKGVKPEAVAEVVKEVAENVTDGEVKPARKKSRAKDNVQAEKVADIKAEVAVQNNSDAVAETEPESSVNEVSPVKPRRSRKVKEAAAEEKAPVATEEQSAEDRTEAEKFSDQEEISAQEKAVEEQAVAEKLAEDQTASETQSQTIKENHGKKNKKVKYVGELQRVQPDPSVGLTDEQVEERFGRGMNNVQPNVVSKSYLGIFRSNVLTLFNFINFVLAALIFVYGELKNMLFIGVVTVNIIVGVVQEIRSKKVLEKMSLIAAPHVDLVRNGKTVQSEISDIVIDDIMILRQGMQIPSDSIVVEGQCEVNESLLTGEQDDVHKQNGDFLYSGSFVQAGECKARVTAVGEDNFTSKLMAEAKKFKKPKSELMRSINWIIRIVTLAIFPLGILMFYTNKITTSTINEAVTGTVASVVGMIPEGLVMLTSIALAVGVVKLARKRTLVQDLYSIETLARVDMLCLDKTGTITEGSMQVEKTHIYSTKFGHVDDIMANMVAALGTQGSTFEAFAQYFRSNEKYEVVSTVPFSSSRKWSAADFGAQGKFIVGAPEFVLKEKYSLVENDVKEYSAQGFRVLVLVRTMQPLKDDLDREKLKPIALIVLSDKIRENAKDTLAYFAKQGVSLKVISGDNPLTVSKVAERAGLADADKFIDATELDTDEKIYDACDKYTIFGRVTPKQKKVLVTALKSKGHTVGMTGDGVNDVMALKEADCSIAMASGSEASRNVAQLVLLDSDFAALPSVVAEGRRVINNIERAASLFLVKTSFSILLTLLLIILQMNYPFEPIQLTLISGLFVGLPSFFLAIEPNDSKVRGSFLSKVFKKALPAGFTVATMVTIICLVYRNVGIDVSAQVSTMAFYVTSLVSFIVLMWVCIPYTKERLYLVAMCLVLYIAAITSSFIRNILSISGLTTEMTINIVFMLLAVFPMIIFWRAEIGAFNSLVGEIKEFSQKTKEYWAELRGKKQEKKGGKKA